MTSLLMNNKLFCNILKSKFNCNFNRKYHLLNKGIFNKIKENCKPHYDHAIFRFQSSLTSIPKENTFVEADHNQNLELRSLDTEFKDSESLSFYLDLQKIINDTFIPLNKLGEPTIQFFGLGSKLTPVGWLQNVFEYLHSNFELPWWSTISICISFITLFVLVHFIDVGFLKCNIRVSGTIAARLLLLPLFLKTEQYSVKLQECDLDVTKLNEKIKKVRKLNNKEENEKLEAEISEYVQKHGISPFKSIILPICAIQTHSIFLIGIRNMVNAEIPSMAEGGIAWFHDLTVCDPYYILPIVACCSSIITFALTVDHKKIKYSTPSQRFLRRFLKYTPILFLPIMMNFSGALSLYWAVNNSFALCQTIFLRFPIIRTILKLPPK